jgi:hypothetical protein
MTFALPKPVLPPALQSQLGLRDPRFRPLSDVKTVLRDLGEFDIDAEQVRNLVELRVLIGFNIATDDLGRCELRVLTKSIDFFRATGGRKYHELEWDKVFRLVVPHKKPVVTGLEIRRALICDRGHVENLVIAGHLTALKKSAPGPGGSWTISRESYEAFLKGRMQ